MQRLSPHILQSREWARFRETTPQIKKVLEIGDFRIFLHRLPYLPADSAFVATLALPKPSAERRSAKEAALAKAGIPNCAAYLPRSVMPNPAQLEKIKIACREEKAVFLKLEPLHNSKFIIHNSRPGRSILPCHTIYINLTLSEGELFSWMHGKTRYNIKLAGKKGVVIKNEESPEALENFIKLLTATESRQGFYSHYPDYYRKLWQTLRPAKMVYLLSAYLPKTPNTPNNPNPVAAILLLRYKNTLYYPYGGSDPQYREFMAPHLLHWEAIKLGKKLGCKTYDLWGSFKEKPEESDPWWGIYRFKKGFGGKEVDFPPAVDIPLSPLYWPFRVVDSLRWFCLRLPRLPRLPK